MHACDKTHQYLVVRAEKGEAQSVHHAGYIVKHERYENHQRGNLNF